MQAVATTVILNERPYIEAEPCPVNDCQIAVLPPAAIQFDLSDRPSEV